MKCHKLIPHNSCASQINNQIHIYKISSFKSRSRGLKSGFPFIPGKPMANREQQLRTFLTAPERPEGTMGYAQLNGFLFAIACSPEVIAPSEWLQMVFNEQDANYAGEKEAKAILETLLNLFNIINSGVISGEPRLPDTFKLLHPPIDNFRPDAPLSHWALGYLNGHTWLNDLWEEYALEEWEEELGACMMLLGFFADMRVAEDLCREMESETTSVPEMAETALQHFEDAMASYASMGLSISEALAMEEDEQMPYFRDEPKLGRNDPCPCGSGKKFKHCCLH